MKNILHETKGIILQVLHEFFENIQFSVTYSVATHFVIWAWVVLYFFIEVEYHHIIHYYQFQRLYITVFSRRNW